MHFYPFNRIFIIKPITQKKEEKETNIELPDSYYKDKQKESKYGIYKVVSSPVDQTIQADRGDTVLVENSMVDYIEDYNIHVVKENYIVLRIEQKSF